MPQNHVHHDVIVAFAKGAEIQIWCEGEWLDIDQPVFAPHRKYRVKPEPHPHQELIDAWRAYNAKIEYFNTDLGKWLPVYQNTPAWHKDTKYRVKPKLYKLELELTQEEAYVLACKINSYEVHKRHAPPQMEAFEPKGELVDTGRTLYKKFDFYEVAAAFK